FFVLLAIFLAESAHPVGAWLALGIASLTRPQMLVFAFVVGIVLIRRFDIRQNATSLAWALIIIFVVMSPFLFSISPSFLADFMRNVLSVQEFGGNEAALTTVSLDAYSVWPLVTMFAAGQSGLGRMFYPSSSLLVGP